MSGQPIICQHCFYRNWLDYLTKKYSVICERCNKDLTTVPDSPDEETIVINGRHIKRKKQK